MSKIIKNMSDLQTILEPLIEKAVQNASEILLAKLQEYIEEDYYKMYSPLFYQRTMAFYESAVANMTGKSSASVGIDRLYMSYQYPSKYKYLDASEGHWTGEDQVFMADAGFHGNVNIYRDGHFWKDFKVYCNKNAINILKIELRNQGINVK